MKINMILPKQIPYIQVLLRTKKYYHLKHISEVINDKENKYYIFLRKRNIQIKIVATEKDVLKDIQNYLNYTFRNSYLGIYEKDFEKIQLQGVRKVRM